MRLKVFAAALIFTLLCLMLVGCGENLTKPEELETASVARIASHTATETEIAEEVELAAGEAVTVDGHPLSGSLISGGTLYVSFQELEEELSLITWKKSDLFGFVWRGEHFSGRAGSAELRCGEERIALAADILWYEGEWYVPAVSFCEALHISAFYDEEELHWYFTPGAGDWELPEGYRVPILMYHAVSDNIWGISGLFVSPSEMEKQLQYLVENGYEPIWFEDLEHVDEYEKPVILSFDDGYLDNYLNLFPLLEEYQVKATFFVITDYLVGGYYMTKDMVREVSESGLVSIQSHTCSHPDLSSMDLEGQRRQFEDSKLAILRITGKEPFVLCYPMGRANQYTRDALEGVYRFGVKMNGPVYYTGDDAALVYRLSVGRSTELYVFAALLEQT